MTTNFEVERNHRILIIDDNTSIHEDIRKILGGPSDKDAAFDEEVAALFGNISDPLVSTRFEIDSAFQGREGLELVDRARKERRPYAMAFIDVRMPPGWDGVETIRRIWSTNPDLQVVICTAYSDYSWRDMIRKVGKTESLVILKKPFDNIEVLQLAHTLTQKWTVSHRLHAHLASLDKVVFHRTEELQSANTRLRDEMEERRQTERDLVESEKRFAKTFQASPIPMAPGLDWPPSMESWRNKEAGSKWKVNCSSVRHSKYFCPCQPKPSPRPTQEPPALYPEEMRPFLSWKTNRLFAS